MEYSTTQEHVEFTGWRRPLIGAQMLFVAFGAFSVLDIVLTTL